MGGVICLITPDLFECRFGQFDKKIAPKKVRNALKLKTTGKIPHVFEKLTIFSLFSRYTPAENLVAFRSRKKTSSPKTAARDTIVVLCRIGEF